MAYGYWSYDGLTEKDFLLPAPTCYFEPSEISQKLFIGLPKWGDMRHLMPYVIEKQNRVEYFKIFNTVELDATHYKIYAKSEVENWIEPLNNPDFLFCPRMYNEVTHRGTLVGKKPGVSKFCESIKILKPNLGPIFLQFNHTFRPERSEELSAFLPTLPLDQFEFFLDLRNDEWFTDKILLQELSQQLHELDIGMVIADTPFSRSLMHMQLPTKKAFIRFYCDGKHDLDFYRIGQWSEQLKLMARNGIQTVFFFLHIREQHSIPEFYNYTVKKFTEGEHNYAGLKLFPPQLPQPHSAIRYPKFKS